MTFVADVTTMNEDDRIDMIGKCVMVEPSNPPRVVGFIVENDEKADRYVTKLRQKFPQIVIVDRVPAGTPALAFRQPVLVRVAGPEASSRR